MSVNFTGSSFGRRECPTSRKKRSTPLLEAPTATRAARGKNPSPQPSPQTRSADSSLENRFIVIEPDEESLAEDAAAGYTLPLSVGRIVEVDNVPELSDGPMLLIEGLFSESFTGKWRVWLERRKPRTNWLASAEVQRDDADNIIFVSWVIHI